MNELKSRLPVVTTSTSADDTTAFGAALGARLGELGFELFEALADAIVRNKPSAAKGTYVKSVTISSTMGPGVSIDPNLFRRAK